MGLTLIHEVLTQNVNGERLSIMSQKAKQYGWEHFYNDVPTRDVTIEFINHVQKALPKVKFYPANVKYKQTPTYDENDNYVTTINVQYVEDFFVYMDEFPFALGKIGCGKYAVNGEGDDSYMVFSRKIQNAKYATHRDQHHMITTTNFKKAVSSACKYLVPFSTMEIATAFYDAIRSKVTTVIGKVEDDYRTVTRPVQMNTVLMAEIEHLTSLGVEFKTQEFRDVAARIKETKDELMRQKSRVISALFVRFRKVGEDTFVELQEAMRVATSYNLIGGESKTVRLEELDPEIAGRVAVLNILNNGQYTNELGMKIDDNHFWVERG